MDAVKTGKVGGGAWPLRTSIVAICIWRNEQEGVKNAVVVRASDDAASGGESSPIPAAKKKTRTVIVLVDYKCFQRLSSWPKMLPLKS